MQHQYNDSVTLATTLLVVDKTLELLGSDPSGTLQSQAVRQMTTDFVRGMIHKVQKDLNLPVTPEDAGLPPFPSVLNMGGVH
jgi:hypothetical protein